MDDQKKSKQELITELNKLRKIVSKFEESEIERKNTEKALRESEALYTALFQNIPIQAVVVDLNGRIIAYNRQKKKSGDRLPRIGDVMYKDYAAKHKIDIHSELIKCIETGKMREFPELKYGEKILNIKIAPFENGAIITSLDITEIKEAEYNLRFSEKQYRTLQANLPIGIYRVSRSGKFIAVNPALLNMLGYLKEEELLDKKILNMFYFPQKRTEFLKLLEVDGCLENFECQVNCKDGSIIWLSFSVKSVRNSDGEILHYDGVSRNVTERKKHEQELVRIRKAVESTSEAVGIFDSFGNFYHNKAFYNMFEFTKEELIAAGGLPMLYKERAVSQDIFKTIMEGKSWTGVVNMIAKSGRELIVHLRADAIKDDNEEIIGLIAVHSDITEQIRFEEESKNFQAQVQHAQKLESLGILAGGIAHDFNNLLLGILGNADLALLEVQPDSSAGNNIKDIITISRRAAELCRQILAYSGKGKFVIEPLDLSKLVLEIGHLIEVSLSKTVILEYDLAENIPLFDADATQIRQVIMNLITNASEAIGEKSGIITIKTGSIECDREYLRNIYFKDSFAGGVYVFLEVSDTGCGMDKKTQDNMFDPFFTTKISGRGLGLAAVMGIIRAHNAACKVTSEPGQGTIFKILFPAAKKQASEPQRLADDTKYEQWTAHGKVVLIDNDEIAVSTTMKMLEEIGFEVFTAKEEDDIIKIIDTYTGDLKLILIDMNIIQINKREINKYIKKLSKIIPVILSDGYIKQEDINKFEGFAGFIHKPYDLKTLKGKIMEVLRNKAG